MRDAAGGGGGIAYLQSYIMFLFTRRLLFFFGVCGFLADRFLKRSCNCRQAGLTHSVCLGIIGFYLNSWTIILVTVIHIGLQATVFSPRSRHHSRSFIRGLCSCREWRYRRGCQHSDITGIAGAALSRYQRRRIQCPSRHVSCRGSCLSVASITLSYRFLSPGFPPPHHRPVPPGRPLGVSHYDCSTRGDSLLAILFLPRRFSGSPGRCKSYYHSPGPESVRP